MNDEPKKRIRVALPPPLPKCGSCVFFQEKLVDNEAGGVKGLVYWCDLYDTPDYPLVLSSVEINETNTACLDYKPKSENLEPYHFNIDEYKKERLFDLPDWELVSPKGAVYHGATMFDVREFIDAYFQFHEVIQKLLESQRKSTFYDLNDGDNDNPATKFRDTTNDIIERLLADILTQYQDQLSDMLDDYISKWEHAIMLRVYDYTRRSIADLKRELFGKEEKPTKLTELLDDGQPPSKEFLQKMGLE